MECSGVRGKWGRLWERAGGGEIWERSTEGRPMAIARNELSMPSTLRTAEGLESDKEES